ncbi:hypothetical protein NFK58_13020 [Citrobacter portucalensis]|uniref:hypothetical protein n=1 Tax=Citrobacter portucalensis TaxID=1639133 RepID=UPI00242EFEC5|nr:hypothetical protein [Citrobacter portucalensis]WFZ22230.1 hypothetical protein NFK58_13020 [Citrobacter portucalensis]
MKQHPAVAPKDWIEVSGNSSVVMVVYPENSPFGVCKVVFNKAKPTTHDVEWDGEKWIFPHRPDYGGYARNDNPFVRQLINGK